MNANRSCRTRPGWGSVVFAGAALILSVLTRGVGLASEYPISQPVSRESCQPDPTVLGAGRGSLHSAMTGLCPNPDPLNSPGPYIVTDQTNQSILWNVVTGPCSDCLPPIRGSRSLWMGQCDPTWAARVGYPNNSYQILYIDTGSHSADYTLRLDYNVSAEYGYDFLYLVGGGGGGADPIGCNRSMIDAALHGVGDPGSAALLVTWTGSARNTTPGATAMDTRGFPVEIAGARADPPENILNATIQIAAEHRALYFVFTSDERFSHEDGLWCQGRGVALDSIATSDNGLIYSEQPSAGLVCSACTVSGSNRVIVGTCVSPIVAARVPSTVGALWAIQDGASLPTGDVCSPARDLATEHFFFGGDIVTHLTIPLQFNSVVGCPWSVPANTATVRASWNEYMDLPRGAGFVRFAEARTFSRGAWTRWRDAASGGGVHRGRILGWRTEIEEIADCDRADSVQLRYTLQCVPFQATDQASCMPITYGVLLDDFQIQFILGSAAPTFGIFPGSIAQTTFVDGTIGPGTSGSNCASVPCWPGIRGTGLGSSLGGIDDNVNSPLGDSMTVSIRVSGLSSGRRINWRHAFDKCVDGGRTIAHNNPDFNPFFDVPRIIYRLFDPSTKTWSPFDSSELDVDALTISAGCGAPTDSMEAGCTFRWDWPPRDKAGTSLPAATGGWPGSIGGFRWGAATRAAYSDLAFLPRGTRLQYYFKGVDNLGTRTYQFQSDQPGLELLDLPTLPGGPFRAPDIMEFDVLPGVYPSGTANSLLAGSTSTPVLNLDDAYTTWGFGQDPMTYALRGLGVRADRYRLLQGLEEGNNIGGHEFPGQFTRRRSNFFPNSIEYPIADSLAAWYRIIIVSSHVRHSTVLEEPDAQVLRVWWRTSTGADGGDRCIFASGDDFFESLLNGPPPISNQAVLAQDVFGVQSAAGAWVGTVSDRYPHIDDRFDGVGPGPAPPGTFRYILDGGCPNLSRFDALTKVGSPDAINSAFYTGGVYVAAVSQSTERDAVSDNDRNKALGYGFSYQFIRRPGSAPEMPGSCCGYGGLRERLRVLYKFLVSCRGPRTPSQTGLCWPCPSDTSVTAMTGNWAADPNFQTATYGPLYPMQDFATATAVEEEPATRGTPAVNLILQNRPNPFNPETTIPYSVGANGRVTIRIYDVAGRCIRVLVDKQEKVGAHAVRWGGETDDGGQTASGIYFYRITYPDGSCSARKMTILR